MIFFFEKLLEALKLSKRMIIPKSRDFDYKEESEDDFNIINRDVEHYNIPKNVWMYWEGDEIPRYIRLMIDNLISKNPGHRFFILNEVTLHDYVDGYLDISKDMFISNKTDLIRLELLKKYGGIWIDSSIIFNEDLSWVHQLDNKYDVVGYYRYNSTLDYSRPIVENWFLCSPPNNELICKWLDTLRPLKDIGARSYYEMLVSRHDYDNIKQNIGLPKYLLAHYALQIAMLNMHNFNIYVRKCENNAFLYQSLLKWKPVLIAMMLCIKSAPQNPPPLIKFTSADRKIINQFLKYRLVAKGSIIGKLLSSSKHNA